MVPHSGAGLPGCRYLCGPAGRGCSSGLLPPHHQRDRLAVETCRAVGNNDITLLKCTSSYPAPIEEANLCMIKNLAERFKVKSGLSDHTIGSVSSIVAVTQGATMIEKHFIIDRSIGGPDASFSMNEQEFT